MNFKVGDKVVRTEWCSDYYTVKQGGEYVISKVDDECNNICLEGVYDNNGQPDWFNPDNFELVEAASKWKQVGEFEMGFNKISTLGYTDKSIFKVIDSNGSCFEVGDLVVIDSERSGYDARFKLVSEYGQYRKPYMNWLRFEGLEYIAELGADMVKENTAIQENKDYQSMSPDTLIPISIDGNDFKVKLGSLVILKKIIGNTNGAYMHEVYNALGIVFDTDCVIRDFDLDTSAVDANSYSDDLFTEYFKPIKEKKELEQKREDEKKSLQSQIEALQEQLKTLD